MVIQRAAKVRQVIGKTSYNFNHPLLMLKATQLAFWGRTPKNETQVLLVGRRVSAFLAACAAVFFCWIGLSLAELRGGWLIGLSVTLCPDLLIHSHYLKEDASLVFGIAFAFLAMARLSSGGSLWNYASLGIGCALSASAKYVGIVVLLFAIPFLFFHKKGNSPSRIKRLLTFAGAFFLVLFVINYEILRSWNHFSNVMVNETRHVLTEHQMFQVRHFGTYYVSHLSASLSFPVKLFLMAYFGVFWLNYRQRTLFEWEMMLFPFAYFLFLSLSPVQMHRYLLPIIVWLHCLAAIGALEMTRLFEKRPRLARLALVGVGSMLAVQFFQCAGYLRQFSHDSRDNLNRWAGKNLSPADHVLAEKYAALQSNELSKRGPFALTVTRSVGDAIKSLDEARKKGITHIVVSDLRYARFFDPNFYSAPGSEQLVIQYRKLYEQIFREGKLVWKEGPARPNPGYTNPTIKVYDIKKPGNRIKESRSQWTVFYLH